MMRTALVSPQSKHPELAASFVRQIVSEQLADQGRTLPLPPLRPTVGESEHATISLEPALLTYLDALKRRIFLSEWESAIIQSN